MKKLFVVLIAAAVLMLSAFTVFAAQNSALRVEYDGLGRVEVDFPGNVRYKDAQVAVQDTAGKDYSAVILDRDEDDLDFVVEDLVPGETYTFTLTGIEYVLNVGSDSFTGSFRVPAEDEIVIKKIDYDREDRELEIDFNTRVEYEQLAVTVLDDAGNTYDVQLRDRDRDSVELRVRGLDRGKEYTVTVSGVRLTDSANTLSITGSFMA